MNHQKITTLSDAPLARALLVIAALVIILAGIRLAQPILVPLLVATFLAILTSPAVSWLVKRQIPTSLAILSVVFLVFVFLYGIGFLVASSADDFFQRWPSYQQKLNLWLIELRQNMPWLATDLRASLQAIAPPDSFIGFAGRLFSGLGSILLASVLTLFILVFMLFEAQTIQAKLHKALGADKASEYVKRFAKTVHRYLAIKSLISLMTGLSVWAFLEVVGIDYPILWATLAFLMNFVPNIGSLLAALPVMLVASIEQGLMGLFISTGGFLVINTLIGNLLEPRLMGKSLDLSTLVVFVSLVFWGWILGPVGALLAVPLTVVVKISLELYPRTIWLAVLLSR